jgi:hypothetical protein
MGFFDNIKDRFNKAEFSVSPNKKLKTISKSFKENFELSLIFYKGNIIADGDLTIAALNKLTSKEVNKKSNEELRIKGNMKVGAVEDEFMRLYNIKVQIKDAAEKKLIPNDITIGQGARGEYK